MAEHDRIAFGSEGRATEGGMIKYTPANEEHCPDCGVRRGTLHDPGCHLEQCPVCREVLAHCGHQREVLG